MQSKKKHFFLKNHCPKKNFGFFFIIIYNLKAGECFIILWSSDAKQKKHCPKKPFFYGFLLLFEGGVRQQRNDGGGCATMRERSKSVESPGTYVTK